MNVYPLCKNVENYHKVTIILEISDIFMLFLFYNYSVWNVNYFYNVNKHGNKNLFSYFYNQDNLGE